MEENNRKSKSKQIVWIWALLIVGVGIIVNAINNNNDDIGTITQVIIGIIMFSASLVIGKFLIEK